MKPKNLRRFFTVVSFTFSDFHMSSDSNAGLYDNLRKLITVVDELRDVGLQKYVNLPRIVVVGTQSSGKSSVLEAVVGMDFLPRGDGVVTRRPLELRLVHLADNGEGPRAWAIFEGSTQKYTDFNEVRAQIEKMTDEVAGKNANIVDDPIILSVYSTQCPDLTLIDLPGITRVPIAGSDQSDDIERVTREMALRYVKDARTIILAVMPANADLSTSDALQLARRVDPQGFRTIGVVTKIDIMDEGTDALRMLRGDIVALKLGFVGIKNRNQQEIAQKKTVADSIATEKAYFEGHRVYGKMPPGYLGTTVLIDKLTKVLFRQIRDFLPAIKKEILEKKREISDRLQAMGTDVPTSEHGRSQLMWALISDYVTMFDNSIKGRYDRRLISGPGQDSAITNGGAHIRTIFTDFLIEYEEDPITKDLTDDQIDKAIRDHEGDSLPGFPSPDTFESLVRPFLSDLRQPSTDCLASVHLSLENLAQKVGRFVFKRFPALADVVLELTTDLMNEEMEITRALIDSIVTCEIEYFFTNDHDYLTNHGSMRATPDQEEEKPVAPAPEPSSRPLETATAYGQSIHRGAQKIWEQTSQHFQPADGKPLRKMGPRYSSNFIGEIRRRVDSYFLVILSHLRDAVPKCIGFYLVRQVQNKIQFTLYNFLSQSDKISDFLGEPPHVGEERKNLQNQLNVLTNAHQVLQRDPSITAISQEAQEDEASPENVPPPARARPRELPKQRVPTTSPNNNLFESSSQRTSALNLFD